MMMIMMMMMNQWHNDMFQISDRLLHFKGDWCRKLRPTFALADPCKLTEKMRECMNDFCHLGHNSAQNHGQYINPHEYWRVSLHDQVHVTVMYERLGQLVGVLWCRL